MYLTLNVIPFSMFKNLQIGNIQPTNMMVEMVDRSKKASKGIIENVLVGEERVSFEITKPMDDPYINYESVCMIECSRKTHEEELELLLANDTQSSFTKMKEQSCIVNTNEKYEPFIQQLNPFSGISHSSKSSIKMGKKGGEITSPSRYDSNLSFFYLEESLRTPDVSCYLPLYFISSEGIDTSVLDELCGYVLWKPSRDFTRPLGPPSGLKFLLHTLNATLIPTKPYRLCTSGGA
ncbi:hypothetical protein Tco_1474258 [Tanacetum coccineum]